jgi:hypothetical protein
MPTHVLGPVSSEERVPLLDALRGFTLCGILVMNIKYFSGFDYALDIPDALARFGPGPGAVQFLTKLLFDGKFYSIFSFLFGLGFSIQLLRGEGKPEWLRLYARRLCILFLFGVVHAYAIWYGDVLRFYAPPVATTHRAPVWSIRSMTASARSTRAAPCSPCFATSRIRKSRPARWSLSMRPACAAMRGLATRMGWQLLD